MDKKLFDKFKIGFLLFTFLFSFVVVPMAVCEGGEPCFPVWVMGGTWLFLLLVYSVIFER